VIAEPPCVFCDLPADERFHFMAETPSSNGREIVTGIVTAHVCETCRSKEPAQFHPVKNSN
jgi:hypothetical protein